MKRGCERAEVEAWHPNQLRHSFASRMAAGYGMAVSQVLLGHATPTTTAVDADRDEKMVAEIIEDRA